MNGPQQSAVIFDEDYDDLLGTNDSGSKIPFDVNFDLGTEHDLANVESNTATNPTRPSSDSEQWSVLHDLLTADSSFGLGQPQDGLSDVGDQPQSNEDQSSKDHEEISNSQNTPADNGQQKFNIEFTPEELNYISNHVGRGDFSEIFDPNYHEPNSHGILDISSNTAQPPVESQQSSGVDTPGTRAASNTASMSRETTRSQLLATPNDLGNVVGRSSSAKEQGASGVLNPTTNPFTEETNDAYDDEDEGDERNEDEDESEEEDEDVPLDPQATFETYNEHDPMIVEDVPPIRWNQAGTQQLKINWGRTGRRNGQELWFNKKTSKWQPSASHHDMRETLIRRAQAEYPNDRYLNPDPTDGLPHGETAFFKPHQFRGPDRQDCADSLFEWREWEEKTDETGKRRKSGKPKYKRKNPGYMCEGDKILLDPHNNPVENYKFIPLTLSAQTDGAKLQEMVLQGCKQVDLWARMPKWERAKNKDGNLGVIDLRGKNTRVNMPMTRFREKKGTIAGNDREGSEAIREGLLRFYHHNGFDPVASGNSVKAFWRDLEPWEVKLTRMGNKARHGARAGKRAVGQDKRNEEYKKAQKAIENGKKRQAAKNGGGNGKRPFQNQDGDVDDSNLGPNKRVYQEPGFIPGHIGSSREGRGKTSKIQRYGTLGVVQTPLPSLIPVNAYQPPQTQHLSNQYIERQYRQPYPGIGNELAASLDQLQPPVQHGGETWPVRTPSEFNRRLHMQHGPGQSNIGQAFPTEPYLPQHIVRARQGQDVPDPAEYNPYVIEENHQRMLHQGMNGAPMGHKIAQNRPISNVNQIYPFPGYANNSHHRPPVQHQGLSNDTDGALKRQGNSLGPGGRKLHQAPKQLLGKRRQQNAGGIENDGNQRNTEVTAATRPTPIPQNVNFESSSETIPNVPQQEQADVQVSSNQDFGSTHKRRRNNGTPGTDPMPQRRRQNGKSPGLKRYGAEGAPAPLISPEEHLRTPQPESDVIEDAEGPLMSPEELFRTMPDLFGSNGDAAGRLPASTGHNYRNNGGTYNETTLDPDRDVVPTSHSEYIQRVAEASVPQQVLGKHQREEPVAEWELDAHFPEQNAGEQQPEEQVGNDENNYGPKPKRRHMPATEGYYSPPAQAPEAARVQKVRKAERDAQLPPPQFHISEPAPDVSQSSQVEDSQLTPPQHIHVGGAVIDVDEAPQVADGQGPDLPQAPNPAQAEQQVPFDIRDVRPADGWQSQSIDNALRYTRDAYLEWTGLEKAPVTNLEDCYNMQNREIQADFELWWRSEENPHRLEPLPELWGMEAWSGTVEDWKAPENMEHLYEVMRRGRWAPRNEDGSLQQPEFHWNTENYDWYDPKVVGQLETAFFLPHQNLGPDREDCPDELFVWPESEPEDESEDEKVEMKGQAKEKRKLNPRPRGPDPGFWIEDGKILLDPHNNPVKNHPNMPLTLSAETEGYKLQLMRLLNPSIKQKDEWARMPWIRWQVPKTDRWIIEYIGTPKTHVNMHSQRFRDEKGTVAGNKRDGSKKIREELKAFFAEYGFDTFLTDSTKGLGRDLTPWEQDLVKLGNTGKYSGRVGETRGLDEETRKKTYQKILKRMEKGRKKAEADAAKVDQDIS